MMKLFQKVFMVDMVSYIEICLFLFVLCLYFDHFDIRRASLTLFPYKLLQVLFIFFFFSLFYVNCLIGRAYLFDQCVNMTIGPPEDRRLMTGLHSVNDIFCKRCKTLIGWTYSKAYEQSQKYKEGKFIIEKIHLHMEESDCYEVNHPAGERRDRWRIRSMSWSSENSLNRSPRPRLDDNIVYEYRARTASWATSPSYRSRSISMGGVSSIGSPSLSPFPRPPTPPAL
mmetsp:Transcript_30077/g.34969  ORF Transcript_30077/g.34969 Transcript_30077/m.34969 type:complete len:227 (-) Transcript_30077:249-929(-)